MIVVIRKYIYGKETAMIQSRRIDVMSKHLHGVSPGFYSNEPTYGPSGQGQTLRCGCGIRFQVDYGDEVYRNRPEGESIHDVLYRKFSEHILAVADAAAK